MSKYIDWVKKDLFGCFRIEEKIVTMTMKQVWRREEEKKCQLQCFHYAMHALFALIYLPVRRDEPTSCIGARATGVVRLFLLLGRWRFSCHGAPGAKSWYPSSILMVSCCSLKLTSSILELFFIPVKNEILTLNEKKYNYKTVNRVWQKMFKYILLG